MIGKRLNPRKADLHRWRETFAEKLRAWGVEAEATRVLHAVPVKGGPSVTRAATLGVRGTHRGTVHTVRPGATGPLAEQAWRSRGPIATIPRPL
jgi:hypothetical protein